jgi:DUF4097 and DUF4098 domain-containing protein YvlB
MASPTMTPPPRPPRSVAGPIVLIIIGIVFLMMTMGVLDRYSFGLLFAKYWPALLILWGVIKLIEYEQAKRSGYPPRGIGAGGVFLIIFVICIGLSATGFVRIWPNIREHIQIGDDQDIEDLFGGQTYNYSDELSKEFPAGGTLRINDDRGTITVNTSGDAKTIKVSIRKRVRAESQSDADNYNAKTKPDISVNDKIVTLNANTQGAGDKGVATDMDVYIPKNADLVITGRRGTVSITGVNGNVSVNHQRGEVDINDQTGNATLDLNRSSARLQRVKGDVTIQGRANEVAVEDVDGAVHLNGEFYESVRLVHVTKTVSFRSSRTDIEFSRLDGRLDLDSGDLRADSLVGPIRLTTRSKDISLAGISGDLRLEDTNGTVDVGVRKAGNIQIDNRKGDVQVTIPPNTAFKVEAQARGGGNEISSDFSELQISNGENQSTATGSIGTNGPKLVINNEHGSIEIRKGTVAVAPPTPPVAPGGRPGKALPAPKAPPVESEN